MGKLKRSILQNKILLKKKDYILKRLPAQRGLSHKETMEYIHIHLPSLYPGKISPGQLGYARYGEELLVFILLTPMKKGDRSRAIVPFLLLDTEKICETKEAADSKGSCSCLLAYRGGHEKINLQDGLLTGIDWVSRMKGENESESSCNLRLSLEDAAEGTLNDGAMKTKDRSFQQYFNSSKAAIDRASPFIHPPVFSKRRIIRMGTPLIILTVMLTLSSLRTANTRQRHIALLEDRLADLTKKAYALTSKEQIRKKLTEQLNALTAYETYAPYTLLGEVYRVIESSGSYTSIRSVRISKNEFSLEGYTVSSLQLLDAFSRAGLFREIELSAVHSADDSKKPLPAMEGFRISGSLAPAERTEREEEPGA